jgi:ATP-dependent RNA circularization protein (DNA/RNA ligase family)
MEYPKIHSLFMRDEKTHKFTEHYSKREFESPHILWSVEEKIDGMNMRIHVTDGKITKVVGRTDDALIPPKLLAWFNRPEFIEKIAIIKPVTAILYGEGFGAGVQKGGIYRPDPAFILFDCYAQDRWGTRPEIRELAQLLGIDCPAWLGVMTTQEVVEYVKSRPQGMYGLGNYMMEGVICRSNPVVRFNDEQAAPVMFKLKVRDFK